MRHLGRDALITHSDQWEETQLQPINPLRRALLGAAIGSLALVSGFAGAALADNSKPVTIIVPYSAGGTNDTFARVLADGMSRELGRSVLVENKPGANGIVGASYVAKAPADGSVLLLGGTGPISLNVMLRPKLPFNFDSFASVAMMFEGPLTISVPTSLGVNSIEELTAWSKDNNKPLRWGTLGPGSVSHLYAMMFGAAMGVEVVPVAYKNTPSSLIDMLGGQNEVSNATPIGLVEYEKSGDLKMLAISAAVRDAAFPDLPTTRELGYPELEATYWTALHAPAGTPPERIAELADAAVKTTQSETFRELLRKNGLTEMAGGPEALDAVIATDREVWGKVIADNNITLSN